MKPVDGLIAAIGVAALVLATLVVLRSREASMPPAGDTLPPAHAPLPPDQDFPACQPQPEGIARWRCQYQQARRQQRIRCVGQRLYYVVKSPGRPTRYYLWPPALSCWNDSTPGGS